MHIVIDKVVDLAVCLRACWSLGVKDRYFRHDSAGDRYLGRTLAMLPILTKEFAISPPYFEFGRNYFFEFNFELLVPSKFKIRWTNCKFFRQNW